MNNLPEWISQSKDHFMLPGDIERWHKALSIAWEALQLSQKNCSNHSGIAENAMRRIEALGCPSHDGAGLRHCDCGKGR